MAGHHSLDSAEGRAPWRDTSGQRLDGVYTALTEDAKTQIPTYYSVLARLKLLARSDLLARHRRFAGRVPVLGAMGRTGKRWAARILLPKEPGWVQVQSGFAQGLWLHLNLDIEGCYWVGNYEPRVQDLLMKACAPGSVFYDIGASLGFFSLAAANFMGPKAIVFAFEPEPANCLRVKEMVFRNNLQDRVRLVEAAVWSRTAPEGLPFRRGGRQATYGGVVADGVAPVLAEGELRRASTVSLDDFLRQGNPAPDVLKIDVEGGECEVLKGGEDLFSRRKPTLICEVHRPEAAAWIENWLAGREYVAEWRMPEELYPRLLFAQPAPASGKH